MFCAEPRKKSIEKKDKAHDEHRLDKWQILCKHWITSDSEPPRDCRRLKILREYDNEKTNLHS